MIGRRQLPVHSPLTFGAVLAAMGGDDPRESLADGIRSAMGAAEVLLLSSGTHALTLALLAAAARRPGAPCAMPGYACYDLVSAAVGAGIPVRLYDLDPRTLAPEPVSLERALEGGAAALVVVHLYGVPVPMDVMRTAADRADALLIEDAAQGTGAEWNGRPLGAWGDLSILSFGRGKGETGGGGGALILREAEMVPRILRAGILPGDPWRLIFTARIAAQWALGRDWLYSVPASIPMLRLGETIYHAPSPLRSMSSGSARVLALTRPLAAHEAEVRRKHALRLRRAAMEAGVALAPTLQAAAGWLRFPVVPNLPVVLDSRAARLGVTRGYPKPLTEVAAMRERLLAPTGLPGAEQLARTLITLPTHSLLTERDLRAIEDWVATRLSR